jgi:hypothetical protein
MHLRWGPLDIIVVVVVVVPAKAKRKSVNQSIE